MKRLICLIFACLLLTGCFHARTSIWVKGNELEGRVNVLTPIKGKGVRALILRETLITIDPKARLPKVPDITLTEEDENKGGFAVK